MVIVALPSPSAGKVGAGEAAAGAGTGIGSAAGRIDQTAVCLEDRGCSKRMWKEASKPSGM